MTNNLPEPHRGGAPPAQTNGYAPPAYYDEEADGGQVNIRRLLYALVRHKWLILAVTVLGTLAGLAYVRTLPSEYVASATVWVEPGRDRGGDGPIRPSQLLPASAWIELLRSYVVLDDVVMQERLFLEFVDPAAAPALASLEVDGGVHPGTYRLDLDRRSGQYQLAAAGNGVMETGRIGDPVGASVGLRWQPALEDFGDRNRIEFTVHSPRDAAMQLNGRLHAFMDRTGNFMRLQMRGSSPVRTAQVLNAVTERFVDVAGDLKGAHLVELTDILEDQLNYAQRNLEEAERSLESFRVATITLPSDETPPVAAGLDMTRNPVMGSFFQLRIEQDQLRRDRQAILSAISGANVSVEALEFVPSVRNSSELVAVLSELASGRAELRALRHRYTDEHAAVQEVAERVRRLEQETVPSLARSLASQLAAREQAIAGQIGEASREMQQIPPRAIEEARLRRQVAVSENLYTVLQRRYEETRLASASTVPDVRILDRASPPQWPVNDEKTRLLLMAFLGSLGLGIAGALLRDRLDRTLRYADQVADDLGLPVLGAIPELGKKERASDRKRTAEALEAFRGIRMNIMYAYGAAGPVTLAISSPGPGDGKSFVTSNLALSFADLGKKVLLIDGDIRRGGLHRTLDRKRSPGLTDYLAGDATLEQIVQSTPYPKVSFIGSGRLRLTAPELISSPPMRELLADLKAMYDVILIDTAPLGAGVDPFVFGTLTGNLVLVLRTDTTNRELAEAKLGLAARLPMRILGSIINGLKDRDHSYYHRYYSYLPGYETVEEDEPITPRLPKVPS
jgi:polysaccharide biosynthesis transport protein